MGQQLKGSLLAGADPSHDFGGTPGGWHSGAGDVAKLAGMEPDLLGDAIPITEALLVGRHDRSPLHAGSVQ